MHPVLATAASWFSRAAVGGPDPAANPQSRLERLVARERAGKKASALDQLWAPAEEQPTEPLYAASVYDALPDDPRQG